MKSSLVERYFWSASRFAVFLSLVILKDGASFFFPAYNIPVWRIYNNFVPLCVIEFSHINYFTEMYFRKAVKIFSIVPSYAYMGSIFSACTFLDERYVVVFNPVRWAQIWGRALHRYVFSNLFKDYILKQPLLLSRWFYLLYNFLSLDINHSNFFT